MVRRSVCVGVVVCPCGTLLGCENGTRKFRLGLPAGGMGLISTDIPKLWNVMHVSLVVANLQLPEQIKGNFLSCLTGARWIFRCYLQRGSNLN